MDTDNKPDQICSYCDWAGQHSELLKGKCPQCGSNEYLRDDDWFNGYDNQLLGGGKFNWNKK